MSNFCWGRVVVAGPRPVMGEYLLAAGGVVPLWQKGERARHTDEFEVREAELDQIVTETEANAKRFTALRFDLRAESRMSGFDLRMAWRGGEKVVDTYRGPVKSDFPDGPDPW